MKCLETAMQHTHTHSIQNKRIVVMLKACFCSSVANIYYVPGACICIAKWFEAIFCFTFAILIKNFHSEHNMCEFSVGSNDNIDSTE